VVAQFLTRQPHFQCEGEHALIPFVDGVDGAFVARLTRVR